MTRSALSLLLSASVATAALAPAALPGPAAAQSQVLNVQNADIRAFIQDVARMTGQTFIVDPRVQGTVTVASDEPLNRAEMLEVLLSTLRANGFVAVPTGAGAYRVVPDEGAATQPGTAGGARYGFVTEIFRLRSIDARQAAESLKPLVGRGGVVQATAGNALIVADYADNIRRVRGLIAQIDQDRATMEIVPLTNSAARETAQVVNQILAAPGTEGPARNTVLAVVPVESSNSLVLRGDAATVARVKAMVEELDRRAQSSGDIRVIRLQHASAEQLLPVLQQLVGQPVTQSLTTTSTGREGLSRASLGASATTTTAETQAAVAPPPGGPRATVARYPGANALVISADPETQKTLADVVRQLDIRREQVLVEAIVVELSDETAKELGVQFLLTGREGSGVPFASANYSDRAPSILGLAGAALGDELVGPGQANQLRGQALNALAGTTGNLFGFGGQEGNAIFGAIVNAVKLDTRSNLLSVPSVLVLDNDESRILVGQEVPITTGEVLGDANTNPFRTTARQDVGIKLEVKPQINAGGGVTLTLRQEVSSIDSTASVGRDLILNKREIETTALVDDGDIVVLGGLLDQDQVVSEQKTPLLGDIPGLGALFKSKVRASGKRNLVVFIRPTIVRSAADAQALTAPRYDYVNGRSPGAAEGNTALDRLVQEYLRARPPVAPAPAPAAAAADQPPAAPTR